MNKKTSFLGALVLSLFALLLPTKTLAQSVGTTYYISNSSGSDSNTGTSEQSAWKTIKKIAEKTYQPGDKILLKKGDVWHEDLAILLKGDTDKPITIGSYGSANSLPTLDGSDEYTGSNKWITSGSNIWKSQLTSDMVSYGPELLKNPKFTSDMKDWYFYAKKDSGVSAKATYESGSSHSGQNKGLVKIDITTTKKGEENRNDIQFFNRVDFAVKKNAYYQADFWVKSSAPATISKVYINKYDTLHNAFIYNPPINSTWRKVSYIFKSSQDATDGRLTIALGNTVPDNTVIYLDEFSLKELLPKTLNFPGRDIGNIILNNGSSYGHRKNSLAEVTKQDDYYFDYGDSSVYYYSTQNPGEKYSSIKFCEGVRIIRLEKGSHHVVIENLNIINSSYSGIFANLESSFITVRNNTLYNIGGAKIQQDVRFGNGIEFWNNAHDILIEKNYLENIYDAGISTQGATGTQYNVLIRNNIIKNSELGIEEWLQDGGAFYNIFVENNTILNSGYQSSHADRIAKVANMNQRAMAIGFMPSNVSNPHDIYIENNVLSDSKQLLLRVDKPFTTFIKTRNNVFYQPNATDLAICWEPTSYFCNKTYDFAHIKGTSRGYWQFDTNQEPSQYSIDQVNPNASTGVTPSRLALNVMPWVTSAPETYKNVGSNYPAPVMANNGINLITSGYSTKSTKYIYLLIVLFGAIATFIVYGNKKTKKSKSKKRK